MDFEERVLSYREVDRQQSSTQWEKGDLLLDLSGESLKAFSEHVNDTYQQLRNYRWVASRYPASVRTDTVSYTHHERVAGREDRLLWLIRAEENHWAVREMIEAIREHDRAQVMDYDGLVAQGRIVVAEMRAVRQEERARLQTILAASGDAGLIRYAEATGWDPKDLVRLLNGEH